MHTLCDKLRCLLGRHEPIRRLIGVRTQGRKMKDIYVAKVCVRCGKTLELGDPL